MAEPAPHQARRAQQMQSQAALQLRPKVLQAASQDRERLLPPQGLPPYRHTLRQACKELPRIRLPRRSYRLVDFMSRDPNWSEPQQNKNRQTNVIVHKQEGNRYANQALTHALGLRS